MPRPDRSRPAASRRRFLVGLAGVAATYWALPARGQFTFSTGDGGGSGFGFGGGPGGGNMLGGLGDLFAGLSLGEEDEIRMGDQLYGPFVDRSGGPYRNRRVQRAIRDLADPILRTSKHESFSWEIVVVDDNTVNAWVVPGGKLAINRGLLRYVDDESELAAVIAHEVGHAELSHVLQQMKTERFQSGLTAISGDLLARQAGGGLDGQMISMLAGPLFGMVTSGYSPEREFEADAHILAVFERTGHDVTKAARFYYTLLQLIPPDAQGTTSLFSTHPGTWSRIRALEQRVAGRPARGEMPPSPAYGEVKATFPTRQAYRRNPVPAPTAAIGAGAPPPGAAGPGPAQYRMER